MTLALKSGYSFDSDASTYIDAVETTDGQVLETGVRIAINEFVLGCKQDGIWTAIKASCILAGARTLDGALMPLVGPAPSNVGPFVSGDYNRKTGLQGDGTTNYLNSNRANDADPQNDAHYLIGISDPILNGVAPIGALATSPNRYSQVLADSSSIVYSLNATGGVFFVGNNGGFYGVSRENSTQINVRQSSTTSVFSQTSTAPSSQPYYIFARNLNGLPSLYYPNKIYFYSIGESLDLALLDTRVSNLMTAIGAAIP